MLVLEDTRLDVWVDETEVPVPDGVKSNDMPPPSNPSSSQIPQVNLVPPTSQTSQEEANSVPTKLLEVLEPAPSHQVPSSSSHSHSPVDTSQVRQLPRLASLASDELEGPLSKKAREG